MVLFAILAAVMVVEAILLPVIVPEAILDPVIVPAAMLLLVMPPTVDIDVPMLPEESMVKNAGLVAGRLGSATLKAEAIEAGGVNVTPLVVPAVLGRIVIEPISKLAGVVEPVPCLHVNVPPA